MTRNKRQRQLRKRRVAVITLLTAVVCLAAGLAFLWPSADASNPAAREEIILPVIENDSPSASAPRAIPLAASGLNVPIFGSAQNTPSPKPATPAPDKTVTTGDTASASKPVPTELPAEEPEDEFPYYLYVEKGSFTLTIYQKDENGEYTDVYKTYRISHGGNKTPAGKFELGKKERWHEFGDGGFVQYATTYHKRLFIHSPLYGSENNKHLWPAYYDGSHGIGKASTGGCLRMVTEASRFIYDECPEGTILEIVNGSPRDTTSDAPPDRDHKRYDPTDVNVDAD